MFSTSLLLTEPYASVFTEHHGSEIEDFIIGLTSITTHPGFNFSFGPPIDDTSDILPGDINYDGSINVSDIVIMVNLILTETPGELLAQQFPLADMDGNGSVDVLDVVTLIQIILANPRTSESDRRELQRQLDRLDGQQTPIQPIKKNIADERTKLIDSIQRKLIKKNNGGR